MSSFVTDRSQTEGAQAQLPTSSVAYASMPARITGLASSVFGQDFIAVDISRAMLQAQGTRIQADLCHLPFGDSQFDFIVCVSVIGDSTQGSGLKELHRV